MGYTEQPSINTSYMENKENSFREATILSSEEIKKPYEPLGYKYGHATAILTPNGTYKIGYCNAIICAKEFKTVEKLKAFMERNPYALLPLMAMLYYDQIKQFKTEQQ